MITETLASLRRSCSILIVAHRLTTVAIAERILVLSRGAVAQTGTWETLLAEDGIFRESAIAQGIETELVGPGARSRS